MPYVTSLPIEMWTENTEQFPHIKYDLGSAHLRAFDASEHIAGAIPATPTPSGKQIYEFRPRQDILLQEVATELFRKETGMAICEHDVKPFQGTTREAVSAVAQYIIDKTQRPKIALPLPNWHFWQECPDLADRLEYFDGSSEDALVHNFKKVARSNVGSLLLAYPAVPLMYTPSPAALQKLDSMARAAGITVIVDDVMRCLQEQRHSVGEHFSEPIIVEGYGKRFGDIPFQLMSSVIAPHHQDFQDNARKHSSHTGLPHEVMDLVMGDLLHRALREASTPTQRELRARNQAFDQGLTQVCPDVVLTRPSEYFLTTRLDLPEECTMQPAAWATKLEQEGMLLLHLAEFYPPHLQHIAASQRTFRITTGQHKSDHLWQAGLAIGMGIRHLGA